MSRNKVPAHQVGGSAKRDHADADNESIDAEQIAHAFVSQYYDYLVREPHKLHRFYKDESTLSFSRGINGSPNLDSRAVGQEQIRAEISNVLAIVADDRLKVEITGFQFQDLQQGQVLVHITGYIILLGRSMTQHFTQSLLLKEQVKPLPGYFVLNDFLRYMPMTCHEQPMATSLEREVGGCIDEDEREAKVSIDLEDDEEEEDVGCPMVNGQAALEAQEEEEEEEEEVDVQQDQHGHEEELAEGEEEDIDEEYDEYAAADTKQEPRTWASMAGRLQQAGGGQLGPSKTVGFAAAPQPRAGAADSTGAAVKGGSRGGGSSSSRPSAAAAHHGAAAPEGRWWLWVSRLPTDPVAEIEEILDCFNALLAESECYDAKALEIERRDPQQEWLSLLVSSQDAADALIVLSKSRQILLRGRPLKAEHHRGLLVGRRGTGRGGSSSGRGFGGRGIQNHEIGEDERNGEGRGGARPKRRLRGYPNEGRDRFGGPNDGGTPGRGPSGGSGRPQK